MRAQAMHRMRANRLGGINMTLRRGILVLPVAVGAATLAGALILATGCERTALGQAQKAETTDSPESERGLVGAWILNDGPDHAALNTFDRDGTMARVVSPPPAKGGQGVWIKIGRREFRETFFIIITDPQTGVVITRKHLGHITLSDDGNAFTEHLVVSICNAAGEDCHQLPGFEDHTFKRIVVEE
jgi:hypothetical protein